MIHLLTFSFLKVLTETNFVALNYIILILIKFNFNQINEIYR